MARSARTPSFVPTGPRRTLAGFRAWVLVLTCAFARCAVAHAQPAIGADPVGPGDDPLFSLESPIGPIDYVAGRGLRLGRTGLTLGGFTTVEIDKEQDGHGSVELDGVNFLVLWEPIDLLRGFAEIEVGNLLAIDTRTGEVESNAEVEIERLYGDLSRSDALNARLGKFQTPVGIWNLVPAEPFTWTATEPILVETAFDEHQTGGAFFGSLFPRSNTLDYWLYGQFLDPLDPSDDEEPVHRSVGGRLRYAGPLGDWAVGSSFLASELDGEWNYLGGVDAFGRVAELELQGEFAIVRGNIPDRNLWSVYLQAVYGLGSLHESLRTVHLVGRYEHFHPSKPGRDANLGNLGLAWIPMRFLILKGGYQFADRETELVSRGLFASISVLF